MPLKYIDQLSKQQNCIRSMLSEPSNVLHNDKTASVQCDQDLQMYFIMTKLQCRLN